MGNKSSSTSQIENKNLRKHTLSFIIFDDLQPIIGPVHFIVINKKNIIDRLNEIKKHYIRLDPTHKFFSNSFDAEEILALLILEGYYVLNKYNRYYVIAFALDYTPFEIYSKNKSSQLFMWKEK